jgi:hypothetical protein
VKIYLNLYALISGRYPIILAPQEAGMFLRRYVRNKEGKSHTYCALVESVRTDRGPCQQVIVYLGELNHNRQPRWQRTVVIYNRQGDAEQLRLFPDDDQVSVSDDPDVVRIGLGPVGWTNCRCLDDVWLVLWRCRLLELEPVIDLS